MPLPPGFDDLRALLGRRLVALRAARGLTQERAAQAMGVTARHLQRLEGGGENPSLETLCRAAEVYGLHPSELLAPGEGGEAPPTLRRVREKGGG